MNEVLAWYMYPEPKGKNYYEKDLSNPDIVIEVFDYCQILLAFITKPGWFYLVEHYGYEELFELDKKSCWIDCETIEEFKTWIDYYISIAK